MHWQTQASSWSSSQYIFPRSRTKLSQILTHRLQSGCWSLFWAAQTCLRQLRRSELHLANQLSWVLRQVPSQASCWAQQGRNLGLKGLKVRARKVWIELAPQPLVGGYLGFGRARVPAGQVRCALAIAKSSNNKRGRREGLIYYYHPTVPLLPFLLSTTLYLPSASNVILALAPASLSLSAHFIGLKGARGLTTKTHYPLGAAYCCKKWHVLECWWGRWGLVIILLHVKVVQSVAVALPALHQDAHQWIAFQHRRCPHAAHIRKGRVQLEAQHRLLRHGLRLHRALTPPLVLQAAAPNPGRSLPHRLQDGEGAGVDGLRPAVVRAGAAERLLPVQPGGGRPGPAVIREGRGGVQGEVVGDAAEQLEDLADRKHHQLLVHAGAVPGAFCELRGTVLEYGAVFHHLEMIVCCGPLNNEVGMGDQIYCIMCQFLCFDCWWFNCLGVPCGGYHNAYCVCSYWLCKPIDLSNIDPECCHVCAFDGWGYNCFCWGNICCAPQSVKDWSRAVSGGGPAQVVIVNNNYTN